MDREQFYKRKNPVDMYYTEEFPQQKQPYPGVQAEMNPKPDCGETSYFGSNRLPGRKALVTGGDSGIGRAAAIAYAREGADVAINYLPSEEKDAQEVKKIIEAEGRNAVLIPGDLSSESFCAEMVREAHQELGGLDILALVAGKQVAVADIKDIQTEQIRKTFEINVFSLFWTIKEALRYMQPGSTIITTSSIQASQPSEDLLDYASTKAAIKAFTQALGKQLATKGIRANSVAPGPIWTPLQISGGQLPEGIPEFGHDVPLKRAGQPVELCGVYVFLASEDSSYITSETFGVTGGTHI